MMLADALSSRYLLFRGLTDAGIPTDRACIAVDVLCGPEPDQDDDQVGSPLEWHPEPEPEEPTEADWQSYREWSLDLENRLLAARMASDFDDVMEAASRLTDADLRAAGQAVG
jgi:hypothetical protein